MLHHNRVNNRKLSAGVGVGLNTKCPPMKAELKVKVARKTSTNNNNGGSHSTTLTVKTKGTAGNLLIPNLRQYHDLHSFTVVVTVVVFVDDIPDCVVHGQPFHEFVRVFSHAFLAPIVIICGCGATCRMSPTRKVR